MENNIDPMLQFFIIRPSLEAGAHLASVECLDHYLVVPGFYPEMLLLTWGSSNVQPK